MQKIHILIVFGKFLRIAIEISVEQSNGVKPDLLFWKVIDRNISFKKITNFREIPD